jgi:stage V sporulation protein G
MQVTEVRVKLATRRNDKLRAFCSVTFDNAFVIRDLKIIEGEQGLFVAMPSRKLSDRCPKCSTKNHLRAKFCNECGSRLPPDRVGRDATGRAKLHADIAHPINAESRDFLHKRMLAAYHEEVERSKQPGYRPVEIYDSPDEYE